MQDSYETGMKVAGVFDIFATFFLFAVLQLE
jgi:hypothetical protein